MIDVSYTDSNGKNYNLKFKTIYLKSADFHTWKWEYTSVEVRYGAKVKDFTRKPQEYSAEICFTGTALDRAGLIDDLHASFETDIRSNNPGTLTWGTFYIPCFFIDSDTYPGDEIGMTTINKVTILCPDPFWIEEKKFSFEKRKAANSDYEFLDYDYGYNYDYMASDVFHGYVTNPSYYDSDFKLTIYGPVSDPYVTIGDHIYRVYQSLTDTDRIEINSKEGTMKKITQGGAVLNIFNSRDKESNIFQKIGGGKSFVAWSGFAFDLTIYVERSEPAWT